MTPPSRFVPCPSCKTLSFYVKQEQGGRVLVVCATCSVVILRSAGDDSQPQGWTPHAPSGGPVRVP